MHSDTDKRSPLKKINLNQTSDKLNLRKIISTLKLLEQTKSVPPSPSLPHPYRPSSNLNLKTKNNRSWKKVTTQIAAATFPPAYSNPLDPVGNTDYITKADCSHFKYFTAAQNKNILSLSVLAPPPASSSSVSASSSTSSASASASSSLTTFGDLASTLYEFTDAANSENTALVHFAPIVFYVMLS